MCRSDDDDSHLAGQSVGTIGKWTVIRTRKHRESSVEDLPSVPQEDTAALARLEVRRQKKGGDILRSYHIMVDGVEIGEIHRGQSRVFSLPSGRHEIRLKIDWGGSRPITVDLQPGKTTSLRCWPNVKAFKAREGLAEPDNWIGLAGTGDAAT